MSKRHWNEHRRHKKSFQAMLPCEEANLVTEVKQLLGIQTDRQLLIKLCREVQARYQQHLPLK
jgi:hypothetical protein